MLGTFNSGFIELHLQVTLILLSIMLIIWRQSVSMQKQ